jgi:uncharacterized membrane protein YoaK (UPF0700 family)
MESDNFDLKPRIPIKIATHFFLGAVCGLALVIAFVRFSGFLVLALVAYKSLRQYYLLRVVGYYSSRQGG